MNQISVLTEITTLLKLLKIKTPWVLTTSLTSRQHKLEWVNLSNEIEIKNSNQVKISTQLTETELLSAGLKTITLTKIRNTGNLSVNKFSLNNFFNQIPDLNS
jgi:hypothetical protein